MSRRVRIKPGKGQSMTGFFGGIIFCFIGLFFVIPVFGAFGIIWTLFAAVITVVNGYNAFSDKGIASHEITIDEMEEGNYYKGNSVLDGTLGSRAGSDTAGGHRSTEERLKEAQSLYDRGLITYDEYQQKRAQILKEL